MRLLPLLYERHIWHYKHTNPELIQKALDLFDRDKADQSPKQTLTVYLT